MVALDPHGHEKRAIIFGPKRMSLWGLYQILVSGWLALINYMGQRHLRYGLAQPGLAATVCPPSPEDGRSSSSRPGQGMPDYNASSPSGS